MSGIDDFVLWIPLDRAGREPLAAQIVASLRDRILSGELPISERIPSSRELAAGLGVARSVVVRAYEQLLGEGYLEARAGSATRVASGIVVSPAIRGQDQASRPRARDAARNGPIEPGHTTHALDGSGPTTPRPDHAPIDLRTGNPFVPPVVPDDWRRAITAAARRPLSSYAPPPLGTPELRAAIAQHAARSRGIPCNPEDVIVTSGTADALLTVALAIGAGTRVAVEDPGYLEASNVFRRVGLALEPVSATAAGLTVAQLERLHPSPEAVLVTPSHQFPLGGRMPAAERTALVAWAAAHSARVIEDDYDSEFRHTGPVLPAIAALDPGGVVAHIGSLNKSFSPSLRCGYLIATAGSDLHESLASARADLGVTVPALTQAALTTLFVTGGFRRYLARTKREYRHRRQLVLDTFAGHGLADQLSGTDGGLHALLRLPPGTTGAAFAADLAQRGVLVEGISEFRQSAVSAIPDDAVAIGYGAEPTHRLQQGLDQVIRALTTSRERSASPGSA